MFIGQFKDISIVTCYDLIEIWEMGYVIYFDYESKICQKIFP
jgi:hypothetical protein